MAGEQTIHKANLIRQEEPKAHAEQARGDAHPAIPAGELAGRVVERHGDGAGDEHHSGNGARAKNEQVAGRPPGVADGGLRTE